MKHTFTMLNEKISNNLILMSLFNFISLPRRRNSTYLSEDGYENIIIYSQVIKLLVNLSEGLNIGVIFRMVCQCIWIYMYII